MNYQHKLLITSAGTWLLPIKTGYLTFIFYQVVLSQHWSNQIVPGRLQAPTVQDDFLLQMLQVNHIHVASRFHVTMCLFSNRSQMVSKCGKDKKVAQSR